MSEYKVGDKVRIVKSDMGYSEDFTGQECFVVDVDESGVDLQITSECGGFNTLYFTNDMVIPVEKWIKWDGGKHCPIPHGTKIIVKYRGEGIQDEESIAGDTYSSYWDHWGSRSDIIAYYVMADADVGTYDSKELQAHFKLLANDQSSATATDILQEATECLTARAVERDREGGERSMKAAVEAFNALTGHKLSEADGWNFMLVLKLARSYGGCFKLDDYIDAAAYAALAGESAGKQHDTGI